MPWHNNGDYYSFKQDSIKQHAPTVSGVYGLFNFRHQIVIGSAANVRDALLHHRRHTKFRFSRFEPTGFTFEICPPERRENRSQELIKEYHPISSPQAPIGLATLYRSWRSPQARAFTAEAASERKPANRKTAAIPAKPAKAKAPLHLNAQRFGLVGAFCGVIFLGVGLFGLVPHLKNMFASVVHNPAAIADSKQKTDGGEVQLVQVEGLNTNENAGSTVVAAAPTALVQSAPVNLDSRETSDSPTGWRAAAAQAAAAPVATPQTQSAASAQPATRDLPASAWSVQAMATTDKQLANDWLQKLKTKGYQAFVVNADIKGHTWHRVRIGAFATRQDAEALRLALKSKEGFRDAFVAGDDKAATTLALHRR